MSWWGSHEERYFLTHVGIFVQDIFTWNPTDPCVGGFGSTGLGSGSWRVWNTKKRWSFCRYIRPCLKRAQPRREFFGSWEQTDLFETRLHCPCRMRLHCPCRMLQMPWRELKWCGMRRVSWSKLPVRLGIWDLYPSVLKLFATENCMMGDLPSYGGFPYRYVRLPEEIGCFSLAIQHWVCEPTGHRELNLAISKDNLSMRLGYLQK